MFNYSFENLQEIFKAIIKANINDEAWLWLNKQQNISVTAFNTAFALMPRKTGKAPIIITDEQHQQLANIRQGLSVNNWTIDRLCRVWLLINNGTADKDAYFRMVENLFSTAEMNELVALYSALPLLPYATLWVKRCAEGIRSNIGPVLEAIMYHNPYPAENLEEAAWNQMILKAFFTEKQVNQIYGLDKRANKELVRILADYAQERTAAGRSIDEITKYQQASARY